MTEIIAKITGIAETSRDGTGSAKRKQTLKRAYLEEDHDTVTISEEARRRSASEDEPDLLAGNE